MNKHLYNTLMNNISNGLKLSLNEGSWGYTPLESDSALDLRDNILNKTLRFIYNELTKHYDRSGGNSYDIIGTIIYILKSFDGGYTNKEIENYLKLYHSCIKNCESDTKWQESWNEPDVIRYELENTKDEIMKTISQHSLDKKFPDEFLKYVK